MKRPTRRAVIEAIKKDYPHGKVRYIEAVIFDSGLLVVEYEVRSKIHLHLEKDTHVTRRVITKSPTEKVYSSFITESWFE